MAYNIEQAVKDALSQVIEHTINEVTNSHLETMESEIKTKLREKLSNIVMNLFQYYEISKRGDMIYITVDTRKLEDKN